MTGTHKYNVFISFAGPDRRWASRLSRVLESEGFVSSFSDTHDGKERLAINLLEAFYNSAVCLLLFGPSRRAPWYSELISQAITQRLERSHGEFRVIAARLKDHQGAAPAPNQVDLPFMPEATVEYETSFDDRDKLRELILLIRGAHRRQPRFFDNAQCREWITRRAKNALNVDWQQLHLQSGSRLDQQVRWSDKLNMDSFEERLLRVALRCSEDPRPAPVLCPFVLPWQPEVPRRDTSLQTVDNLLASIRLTNSERVTLGHFGTTSVYKSIVLLAAGGCGKSNLTAEGIAHQAPKPEVDCLAHQTRFTGGVGKTSLFGHSRAFYGNRSAGSYKTRRDDLMIFVTPLPEPFECLPPSRMLVDPLARQGAADRHTGVTNWLCQDIMLRLSVVDKSSEPRFVSEIVVSLPPNECANEGEINNLIEELDPLVLNSWFDCKFPFLVSPVARFCQPGSSVYPAPGLRLVRDDYSVEPLQGLGAFADESDDRSGFDFCRFTTRQAVMHSFAHKVSLRARSVRFIEKPFWLQWEGFNQGEDGAGIEHRKFDFRRTVLRNLLWAHDHMTTNYDSCFTFYHQPCGPGASTGLQRLADLYEKVKENNSESEPINRCSQTTTCSTTKNEADVVSR